MEVGGVIHERCRRWGVGRVIGVGASVLEGGAALVRIRFQNGRERTFVNDMEHEPCCDYLA